MSNPLIDREPVAVLDFNPDAPEQLIAFLKRTRSELRTLRKVRLFCNKVRVFDINHDFFEIRGLGFPDENVIVVLDHINAAYKRAQLHNPPESEYKEFMTGRRYAWAADRVM